MRIYNIVNLDFGKDRLKEFCINNFNSLSASIKSIIAQVRVNVKNIKANNEGLNELASSAVLQDENGNIAYGGATIPSDVDTTYFHIFYPNGSCRVIDPLGGISDTINAYVRNDAGVPRWQYIATGKASLNKTIDGNFKLNRFDAVDNGGQLPTGVSIPWVLIFNIDTIGNVNIKTGSTYTATL